jgi:hypothetical protein
MVKHDGGFPAGSDGEVECRPSDANRHRWGSDRVGLLRTAAGDESKSALDGCNANLACGLVRVEDERVDHDAGTLPDNEPGVVDENDLSFAAGISLDHVAHEDRVADLQRPRPGLAGRKRRPVHHRGGSAWLECCDLAGKRGAGKQSKDKLASIARHAKPSSV